MTVQQTIQDFRARLEERVDNLCAIYGEQRVRGVAAIFLALDTNMALFLSILDGLDVDLPEETLGSVGGALANVGTVITTEAMLMSGVPEARFEALLDDMKRLVDLKHQAERDAARAAND